MNSSIFFDISAGAYIAAMITYVIYLVVRNNTTGIIASSLTIFGFVGFFLRDLMMARWFGIGNDLDLFFVGMMIPMFLVAIFSIPLGSAFIPVFLNIKENKNLSKDQVFVSHLSFLFTCFLGFVCVILFLVSSHLMPLLGWNFSPQKLQNARTILILFLPVLFLSGLMLIANSLLNALGKFLLPVFFQLIVPVSAIGAIIMGGRFWGVRGPETADSIRGQRQAGQCPGLVWLSGRGWRSGRGGVFGRGGFCRYHTGR